MRPQNSTEYPFTAAEEPRVQVTVVRPRALTMRPTDDGRATLIAELDRLRARAEALVLTPEVARGLGVERAGEALAAIATLRRAIDDGSERLSRALGAERIQASRRRVAG